MQQPRQASVPFADKPDTLPSSGKVLGRAGYYWTVSYNAPPERPLRKKLPFRPPKRSGFIMGLVDLLLPTILRRGYRIVSVGYVDSEVERYRSLLNDRALITPNHPTHAEPVIALHLSKKVGKPYFYLSNREAFGFAWGLFGFILQRVGAYSILRGAPDRESFKTTKRLLSEGPNHVVIFPEGEVYSQNDSLLPFQAGVFQLAFLALEEMTKAGIDKPLYLQPVAIRYRFTEDMSSKIQESMAHLEEGLALPNPPPEDRYLRLRRIGDALLAVAERAYELPRGTPENLDPRIDAVRNKIVERVADALHLTPESLGKTLPERMRALMNDLNGITSDEDNVESDYHERLLREEAERTRPLIRDLQRLSNWVAVRDNYVGEHPSQERVVDTLWRLESEVLGRRLISGKRACFVRLPEPIDLRQYREAYKESKRKTIQEVTARVEGAIQECLREMGKAHPTYTPE